MSSFSNIRGATAGFLFGTLYVLVLAGLFSLGESHSIEALQFVSLAMIVGAPIAVGVVTVFFATKKQAENRPYRLLYPWITIFGWSIISIVFSWETVICVAMLVPIFLPLASIGGAIGGHVRYTYCNATNRGVVSCFAVLPMLMIIAELPYESPTLRITITTSVQIDAPREKVWNSLPNVKQINSQELPWTLSHFLGIPKPISAQTRELVVAGIRDIRWEKGVNFQERITQIKEFELLEYEVYPDKQSMKLPEFDTHIVIGDQYFDVESGRYTLESIGEKTILSLSTTYRMTTNLNWYGRLWADWVLDDFHSSVLDVLRKRNEI